MIIFPSLGILINIEIAVHRNYVYLREIPSPERDGRNTYAAVKSYVENHGSIVGVEHIEMSISGSYAHRFLDRRGSVVYQQCRRVRCSVESEVPHL